MHILTKWQPLSYHYYPIKAILVHIIVIMQYHCLFLFPLALHGTVSISYEGNSTNPNTSSITDRGLKKCLVPITLPYLVFVPYPKVFLRILLKNELFLPKTSLAVLNINSPTIELSVSGWKEVQVMHIKTITTRQTFIEAIQLQGIVWVKEQKW